MKNTLKTDLIQSTKVIILATIIALGANYAFAAWTNPPANPPASNAGAPINTEDSSQEKDGDLTIRNSDSHTGNALQLPFGQLKVGLSSHGIGTFDKGQFFGNIGADFYCDRNMTDCTAAGDLGGGGGGGASLTVRELDGNPTVSNVDEIRFAQEDGLSVFDEGGGAVRIDIRKRHSLQANSNNLQLVGDVASPGANKVYGTDGSGNRGWQDSGGGGGENGDIVRHVQDCGTTTTCTQSCPAGGLVTGGGCDTNSRMKASWPSSPTAWTCTQTSATTLTNYVICLE